MHIILGADGHVGSATAKELLKQRQDVTVVLHSDKTEQDWKQKGAEVAVVDVNETDALHAIFNRGDKAFILIPPADPSTDVDKAERNSVASILRALDGSSIKKVVAESTYGAQKGERIRDLGVLYEMEQDLAGLKIPVAIIRAAYYMSNWAMSIATAKDEGVVYTFYPIGFSLPMVAPQDLGHYAARLLMEPIGESGLHYVEGPEEYTSQDVAEAFSKILHKEIKAVEIPEEKWLETLEKMGFSDPAAKSMAGMTKLTVEKIYHADSPFRGKTTLEKYLEELVNS